MTPPKDEHILIVDRLGQEIESELARRAPQLSLRRRTLDSVTPDDFEWARVFVGFRLPENADPGTLDWAHCTGAGVDSYLHERTWPAEVLLTRTTGQLGQRMAEACLARALAHLQRLIPQSEDQRARRWAPIEAPLLRGRIVIVLGTGSVGRPIASLFRAVGARVTGVSRGSHPAEFDEVITTMELPAALPDASFLIAALPLTADTEGIVDRTLLTHARELFLINVARGRLVREADLLWALDQGYLRGAALDVFETEPLPESSPLWERSDVMISPHVSGLTHASEAVDAFLRTLAERQRHARITHRVETSKGY